jgi:hypothetical protein
VLPLSSWRAISTILVFYLLVTILCETGGIVCQTELLVGFGLLGIQTLLSATNGRRVMLRQLITENVHVRATTPQWHACAQNERRLLEAYSRYSQLPLRLRQWMPDRA